MVVNVASWSSQTTMFLTFDSKTTIEVVKGTLEGATDHSDPVAPNELRLMLAAKPAGGHQAGGGGLVRALVHCSEDLTTQSRGLFVSCQGIFSPGPPSPLPPPPPPPSPPSPLNRDLLPSPALPPQPPSHRLPLPVASPSPSPMTSDALLSPPPPHSSPMPSPLPMDRSPPPILAFDTPPIDLIAHGRSCSGIHLSWHAPENTGAWSAAVGYLVAYRRSASVLADDDEGWLAPGAAFENGDVSALELLPPHVLVTARGQTTVELEGLAANVEYTAAALPRNEYGWGTRWSSPVYFRTASDTLPPIEPDAPLVHPMDPRCSDVGVRLPAAELGVCRRPAEFAVQVRLGHHLDASGSWTTVRRTIASPLGELARVRVVDPTQPFQVRLVAQNAKGVAPSSEPTTVRPGEHGGCVSALDWDPKAPPIPTALSRAKVRVVVGWTKVVNGLQERASGSRDEADTSSPGIWPLHMILFTRTAASILVVAAFASTLLLLRHLVCAAFGAQRYLRVGTAVGLDPAMLDVGDDDEGEGDDEEASGGSAVEQPHVIPQADESVANSSDDAVDDDDDDDDDENAIHRL